MTVAPGMRSSPRISPGTPAATTTTSAIFTYGCNECDSLCRIVTVASAASISIATGAPTTIERPIIAARRPRSGQCGLRSRSSITAAGVAGTYSVPLPKARCP